MIVYHGTQHRFEKFDPARGGRGEGASNGALGVWVTDRIDIAGTFGDKGYVMTLNVPVRRAFDLPIEEFAKMHQLAEKMSHPHGFYEGYANGLVKQGYDLIRIVEIDGTSPTMVCLKPEMIVILDVT